MKEIKQAATLQIIIRGLAYGLGTFLLVLFILNRNLEMYVKQSNLMLIITITISLLIFLFELCIRFKRLSKVTNIIWDDSLIILKSKDSEIKIYTNDIVGIKQHYKYVNRDKKVAYYDYYTLYMYPNMEKVNLDLIYFSKRNILLDEINLQLAHMTAQSYREASEKFQTIERYYYSCGFNCKLDINIENHEITFNKGIYPVKKVNIMIQYVIKLNICEEKNLKNRHVLIWSFELQDGKRKMLLDEDFENSNEKYSIRRTLIGLCQLYNIPIEINLDKLYLFEDGFLEPMVYKNIG